MFGSPARRRDRIACDVIFGQLSSLERPSVPSMQRPLIYLMDISRVQG